MRASASGTRVTGVDGKCEFPLDVGNWECGKSPRTFRQVGPPKSVTNFVPSISLFPFVSPQKCYFCKLLVALLPLWGTDFFTQGFRRLPTRSNKLSSSNLRTWLSLMCWRVNRTFIIRPCELKWEVFLPSSHVLYACATVSSRKLKFLFVAHVSIAPRLVVLMCSLVIDVFIFYDFVTIWCANHNYSYWFYKT